MLEKKMGGSILFRSGPTHFSSFPSTLALDIQQIIIIQGGAGESETKNWLSLSLRYTLDVSWKGNTLIRLSLEVITVARICLRIDKLKPKSVYRLAGRGGS